MKRIVLPLALIATLAFAGTAAAAPSVTPAGWTGACNMINENALPGMWNAMTHDNPNGSDGMWGAVYHTTGNTPQEGCK
ncbi:MAG: hypothetical protein M0Z49_05185 [Chloroflexi bacterium]|nr:hypothetical protein [Chloroflexota bacterium]